MSTKIHQFLFPFTESISKALKELFPRAEVGIFPVIRTERYSNYPNLTSLRRIVKGEMKILEPTTFLVLRENVVIGWKQIQFIYPISNLFGETNVVFDIDKNKFVTLPESELKRLGVNPEVTAPTRMAFIRAADEAAHAHANIVQANHQANPNANYGAINEARIKAHYQASLDAHSEAVEKAYDHLKIHKYAPDSALEIHQAYHDAYGPAFQHYLRREQLQASQPEIHQRSLQGNAQASSSNLHNTP